MLQQALANTYPPSRYRSVEITATNPMYQDVDNVFSQDKQIAGSMNLYLKESPESEALFNNYLGIKAAAQKAFSSYKPEDINLALNSLKNNPLLVVQLLIAAVGSKLKVSIFNSPSLQLINKKAQTSIPIFFFMILYFTQKYNIICRYSVVCRINF